MRGIKKVKKGLEARTFLTAIKVQRNNSQDAKPLNISGKKVSEIEIEGEIGGKSEDKILSRAIGAKSVKKEG